MRSYKLLLRVFLTERIKTHRKANHITQEGMAEQLRISPRSYNSLERGAYGCSASTLMFFLLVLSEPDVIQLRADFRDLVREEDSHEVA